MTRRERAGLVATAVAVSVAGVAPTAHAGGMFFTDRGVRALARGGAFVAGADDLGAIGYNPAGIVDAGTSLFIDVGWLDFTSEYSRQKVLTNGGSETQPTVKGTTPFLPIPTLAGSLALGANKRLVIAAGVRAPYAPLSNYPRDDESPTRYSVTSLKGSILVIPGVYAAWRPLSSLRVGVGFEVITGQFAAESKANVTINSSASPEDPSWDATHRTKAGPIFTPSGTIGVIYEPIPQLRIGASGQLPFSINAPAEVDVDLPNRPMFASIKQVNRRARVKFTLPAVIRLGVEVRPVKPLRVEVAYVREFWSAHDTIDVSDNDIAFVKAVPGADPIALPAAPPPSVTRNFKDSQSFRLGAEYRFALPHVAIDVRAGLAYDRSAVPRTHLSVLTIDIDKVTASAGVGLHLGEHWRLDALFARTFSPQVTVSIAEAQIRPIRVVPNTPQSDHRLNAGKYSANANIIGIGARYTF